MSADQGPPGDRADTRQKDDRPGVGDATMKAAILYVAATAAVMALITLIAFDARAAAGVALGGAIATANLYVFARIGEAFISRKGRTAPWAVVAVLKLGALLGGVWLILQSGVVSGVFLTAGYASLVVGITLGTLFGPKPPDDDSGAPDDDVPPPGDRG